MDPRCRIELLGPLRLLRGGEAHTRFGTQKAAALLAYFALYPGPHAREQIIDLFWPDMDLPEGRNNLSTALSGLRRLLEPPGVRKGSVLATTHAQAGLDPAAVTTDVADFERRLREAEKAGGPEERARVSGERRWPCTAAPSKTVIIRTGRSKSASDWPRAGLPRSTPGPTIWRPWAGTTKPPM